MKEKTGLDQTGSYEADRIRLEAIIESLEKDNPTLDERVSLFEEGMVLIRRCEAALSQAAKKVQCLTETGALSPFEGGDYV